MSADTRAITVEPATGRRTWRDRASDAIAEHAKTSYLAANRLPDGRMRRRHVPYRLPEIVDALIRAMNKDDEHEGKRLLLVNDLKAWTLV